ncbi:GGDEF domain-containing protein [Paraburkholderia dinghuensis]|uniref:diguanylate cyclase n=1 Tax=Paraburkholderia dinghuensis TaxID=2305225 RepID=A0A3N6N591_9BURK|nr:GGDEF domain-containing protein [Paraburkholderia dinghuensis]RQH09835.1 GGDEF domain-containing protein [Paraburkholderia dinghuensis]
MTSKNIASNNAADTDMEKRIGWAMFRHMLGNAAIPLLGSGAGSLLVAGAFFWRDRQTIAIPWLVVVYATIVIRIYLTRWFRGFVAVHGFSERAGNWYALSVGLSGIAWGFGALLLNNAPDVICAELTITAIQAMVMGGAITLGAVMPAFFAFSIPAILPMVGVLASSGEATQMVLAGYSLIFFVLVSLVARNFNRSLRRALRLKFENEALVDLLTERARELALRANTDGLTGLGNRLWFDQILESEWARLKRSGAPLSVILLDVDHFKLFNDTYGHVAGDACLKQIAQVMKEVCRSTSEFVARYGGEEFIVLLPEVHAEAMCGVAERIRTRIADLEIPHETSQTAHHITASLGAVTVQCGGSTTSADAVALADEQLYRAKALGRNRVEHLAWGARDTPA